MLMRISGILCALVIGAVIAAFFIPGLLHRGSGFSILLLLLCPVSMVLMMWSMQKDKR